MRRCQAGQGRELQQLPRLRLFEVRIAPGSATAGFGPTSDIRKTGQCREVGNTHDKGGAALAAPVRGETQPVYELLPVSLRQRFFRDLGLAPAAVAEAGARHVLHFALCRRRTERLCHTLLPSALARALAPTSHRNGGSEGRRVLPARKAFVLVKCGRNHPHEWACIARDLDD
jgi:hypothetical protein